MRSAWARSISLSAIDDESYRLQAKASGMTPWLIDAFSSLFRSIEEGRFSAVSRNIARLVGHQAAMFSSFLSK